MGGVWPSGRLAFHQWRDRTLNLEDAWDSSKDAKFGGVGLVAFIHLDPIFLKPNPSRIVLSLHDGANDIDRRATISENFMRVLDQCSLV